MWKNLGPEAEESGGLVWPSQGQRVEPAVYSSEGRAGLRGVGGGDGGWLRFLAALNLGLICSLEWSKFKMAASSSYLTYPMRAAQHNAWAWDRVGLQPGWFEEGLVMPSTPFLL